MLRRDLCFPIQVFGRVKNTTANEYMQELPERVQQMVGAVYELLTAFLEIRSQRVSSAYTVRYGVCPS